MAVTRSTSQLWVWMVCPLLWCSLLALTNPESVPTHEASLWAWIFCVDHNFSFQETHNLHSECTHIKDCSLGLGQQSEFVCAWHRGRLWAPGRPLVVWSSMDLVDFSFLKLIFGKGWILECFIWDKVILNKSRSELNKHFEKWIETSGSCIFYWKSELKSEYFETDFMQKKRPFQRKSGLHQHVFWKDVLRFWSWRSTVYSIISLKQLWEKLKKLLRKHFEPFLKRFSLLWPLWPLFWPRLSPAWLLLGCRSDLVILRATWKLFPLIWFWQHSFRCNYCTLLIP